MSDVTAQHNGFETVFRDSKDGLAIFKDGYFVDCNQSMVELVGGRSKADFLGLTPFDFSPEFQPDGQSSVAKGMRLIERCYNEGSMRFEWVHKKFNDELFWCEVIITKMTLNGEVVIHANWRNISETKQLQLELAEQKEIFETLFDESLDSLSVFDGKQYIDCNKAFVRMFGFASKEEVIGIHPASLSPEYQPDGRTSKEAAQAVIQAVLQQDLKQRFEWVHKKIDGTEFWTEVILSKVTLNGVDAIYAVIRDISEKKDLEFKLAQQKQTFETLFTESKDGLTIYDGRNYLDCNNAFANMMGFDSKEDMAGLNPLDISPEFQNDGRASVVAFQELSREILQNGKARFEWLHQKVDGTPVWTEIIVATIVLNGEEVFFSNARDISEKKMLELEIVQQNEELNQSNEALERTIEHLQQAQDKLVESEKMASLGSLVAGVAHEINTPIGVGVMGITQLMDESKAIRKRYKSGEITEGDFEDFLNSTDELSEIVRKNLDRTAHLVRGFKQIAVDQTSEEEREINLNDYVKEVLFSLGSVTRKANVSVALDCPVDIKVIANPGLISQVLTNLIVNSINHGFSERPSGCIDIEIREISAMAFTLHYKDNGKGISAANLPKIFDPFFTTNRSGGGTGLGLNVTYNIITNALGGSIECHSVEGEGVEFVISFKVKQRL